MDSTQNFVDLKIMVDKKKNKVIFAEADGNFVDTLFSFLTLPLGTIVRLLGDGKPKSQLLSIGCFSNLYESVKNLDNESFCSEMCKDMLLNPKSSLEKLCQELKISIDDTETECFKCPYIYDSNGPKMCSDLISIYDDNGKCSICGCWRSKDTSFQDSIIISGSRKHEVFVTNTAKFIITDDLQVMLPGKVIELLNDLSILDMNMIEERIVRFDLNQFLELLKWMFLSATPLTDLFVLKRKFPCRFTPDDLERPLKKRRSMNQAEQDGKMKIKVMLKKSNREVVFAEAQQDFIDFLFSFLTIPLGQMLRILDGQSCLQSIDSLYKSALALDSQHFISANHFALLMETELMNLFSLLSIHILHC